jgi:hypothetical protein
MQLFLNLFVFTYALHVPGSCSTRLQEHITVLTASGVVTQYCRASVNKNKFKKSCILLAVICNYIMMHGHVNIKFMFVCLQKFTPDYYSSEFTDKRINLMFLEVTLPLCFFYFLTSSNNQCAGRTNFWNWLVLVSHNVGSWNSVTWFPGQQYVFLWQCTAWKN